MRNFLKIFLIFLISTFILSIESAGTEDDLTAYQIMERVDNRTIPSDFTAEMTMNLIDKKSRTRSRKVKTHRLSDEKQIMWFLHPAEVKGSSFFSLYHDDRDDDMWLYLPAFGKVRRIASHAKKGSFMGSDFTFEDLGDRNLNDYKYSIQNNSDMVGERECWVVESVPESKVTTDYSKIVSWIWKDDYFPVKEEFYDKKGNLRKIKRAELTKIGKYWLPKRMVMEDLKSKHKTELIFDNIQVDTGLDEGIFDTSQMKRIH